VESTVYGLRWILVSISVLGGLICLGLAAYAWNRRDIVSAGWFAGFILVVGATNLTRAVFFASPTEESAYTSALLFSAVSTLMPPAFLVWTSVYTGSDDWITGRRLAALGGGFGAYLLFVLGEPIHRIAITEVRLVTENGLTLPTMEPHTTGTVVWALSLLLVGLGFALLLRYYLEARSLFRRQVGIIIAASTLPMVANLVFFLGFSPHPGMDLTTVFIAVESVIIAWALFRYDFLGVAPLAGDALVDQIPDPAIAVDEADRIVDHNDAATVLFDGGDVLQQPLDEVVAPIDGDGVIRLETKEGTAIYDPQVSALTDQRGIERGRSLLLRDVTVQEQRLETLQELQVATRQFMDSANARGIATGMVDAAERVLDHPYAAVFFYEGAGDRLRAVAVSDAVEEIVGDEYPVLTDDQYADVVELDGPHVFQQIGGTEAVLADGMSLESALVVPLGEHGVLAIASPDDSDAFDADDERFAGILGAAAEAAMDSATRTQQLRESQQLLRRRSEEIEFFNSILRHDLLNGINVIQGKAAVLESHVDDEGREHLESIQEWAADLTDLTTEIREMVRAIEENDTASLEPTDLSAVVGAKVQKLRETYPAASVSVDVDDGVRVTANRLLEQVVENLLMNAVEHNDGDDPRIDVTAEIDGDVVRLSIADDGPGVPPAEREDVFDPEVTSDPSDTYGFGLYFVKTMVESYGGDVWFEGSSLGGAAAVLELPRAEDDG